MSGIVVRDFPRADDNRARFEKGEFGLDVYGMRERLKAKGLRYVDGPEDVTGKA